MWSTLLGEPVVGPLVGKGIALKRRSVVTTTWGEWQKRHPDTTVLSLKTGHTRDYGEGVAYHDYFATDRVMFSVPELDDRLPNKREVVALRNEEPKSAVAIDTNFLKKTPLYLTNVGKDKVVIVTTKGGESRVYQVKDSTFTQFDGWNTLTDSKGKSWTLTEEALVKDGTKLQLPRYPSHQSFWFGWQAQYPETKLIR